MKVKNKQHGRRRGRRLDARRGRPRRAGSARSCVGFYEDGELRYAGRVGSGFTEAELKRVQRLLEPLARDDQPVHGRAKPPKQARFVEPELVASVEYCDMTDDGTLRHPVYKGLRDDIDAARTSAGPNDVLRRPSPRSARM